MHLIDHDLYSFWIVANVINKSFCWFFFFFVKEIELGISQVALAGGSENMTQAPFAVRDIRFGTRFGQDLKVKHFTGHPVCWN